MSATHFADDDTLAYIANLEAELSRYREAEKALPDYPTIYAGMGAGPHVSKPDYDKLRAHVVAIIATKKGTDNG